MSKQYHILIIEDHRELARVLRTGIESLGEHFIAFDAPSGEEALLEARRRHIDLAIVDMRLPGMDGLELAHRLRERHPQVKIFLVSGQEESKIQAAAAEIKADAWFRKPLELADLLDAMERALGLVDSVLGPMPASIDDLEEKKAVGRMSDLMADLREATQARAVALLNDVGYVVLQAGSLDQQNLPQKALLTLVSMHTTSGRLARLLHSRQERHLFSFYFDNLTLHFATVNAQYALLLVCNTSCRHLSLDSLSGHIQTTATGLQHIMERLGIVIPPRGVPIDTGAQQDELPAEEEEEDAPATGDNFIALLEQELPQSEAEAFWDALSDDPPSGPAMDPDVLSYEQAQRLGLAPTEDNGG